MKKGGESSGNSMQLVLEKIDNLEKKYEEFEKKYQTRKSRSRSRSQITIKQTLVIDRDLEKVKDAGEMTWKDRMKKEKGQNPVRQAQSQPQISSSSEGRRVLWSSFGGGRRKSSHKKIIIFIIYTT